MQAFLIYPMIAQKTFSAFGCEALEDGSAVLRVDYSTSCWDATGATSSTYSMITIYGILMMVVHVAGLPLVCELTLGVPILSACFA